MPKLARWLGLALVVIGLDQWSKLTILAHFQPGEMRPVLPFFSLVLAFNPGAAFSFLADAGGWQKWFFLALALGISAWIIQTLRREPDARWQNLALSLVLGGALGNVIDRVAYGKVVDFLLFYVGEWYWPAFNVADSAICVGAGLLVWEQFRRPQAEGQSPS
ncbi:MAG: hypothetical protein RIR00_1415 [Pseudomonadota bacterium]|jgi:signal peptidase II